MRLAFTIVPIVGLFMSFSAIPAAATSFKCATADTPDRRAICADPGLSLKDEKLAGLYTNLGKLMEGKSRGELAASQHAWLQGRAECKGDQVCLVALYDRRTAQLQRLDDAPQSVGSVSKPNALNTFRETGQCKECNLAGADLSGIKPAATSDDAKLCTINAVANGVFDGARVEHANFVSCNTRSDSTLDSMSWDGASLKGTDFTGANLGGNSFKSANLTGANLSGATLFWVNMSNATMRKANLTGARSTPDAMNGLCSDFSNADFSDVTARKAELCGSFYNANFAGANLRNAKISGRANGVSQKEQGELDIGPVPSDPSAGDFGGKINLAEADLRGATLFSETKLTPKGYGFAILCRTKMPDGTVSNRDCKRKTK